MEPTCLFWWSTVIEKIVKSRVLVVNMKLTAKRVSLCPSLRLTLETSEHVLIFSVQNNIWRVNLISVSLGSMQVMFQ